MGKKIIAIGILVLVLVGLLAIGLSNNVFAGNSSSKILSGQWKVSYSTDTDYFVYIADKTQQKTKICLLSKTADSATGIDTSKNTYDEKGDTIETLTAGQKEVDGKSYYGYCYNTNDERYLKFGEHSTVIIYVSYAEHLDSGKNFIEDVTDFVKTLDWSFSFIPAGDYLRVVFERNLSNTNEITIYANSSTDSEVSFYDNNDYFLGNLNVSSYKNYGFKLSNLQGNEDTFYLKSAQDVWYDYIVDPGYCVDDPPLTRCIDIYDESVCGYYADEGCAWSGQNGDYCVGVNTSALLCGKLDETSCNLQHNNWGQCSWDTGSPTVAYTSPTPNNHAVINTTNSFTINATVNEQHLDSGWVSDFHETESCVGNPSLQACSNLTQADACIIYSSYGCHWLTDRCNGTLTTTSCHYLGDSTFCTYFTSGLCTWHASGSSSNRFMSCTGTSPDFACKYTNSSIANGKYSYNVYANDSGGNEGSAGLRDFYVDFAGASDTCVYSGSGNWNVNCSDNCNITSSANVTGNIFFSGVGNVSLSAKINLAGSAYVDAGCNLNLMRGSGFNLSP